MVNSCIRDLRNIRNCVSRKSSAAGRVNGRGGGGAVSKLRRTISMKITLEFRKRCNIATELERW